MKHFLFVKVIFLIAVMALSSAAEGGPKRKASDQPAEKRTISVRVASAQRDADQSTAGAAAASSSSSSSSSSPGSHPPRFARATLDAAFKHMLLDDEDREPLISFLQAFTGIPIASVTHSSPVLPTLKVDPEEK